MKKKSIAEKVRSFLHCSNYATNLCRGGWDEKQLIKFVQKVVREYCQGK